MLYDRQLVLVLVLAMYYQFQPLTEYVRNNIQMNIWHYSFLILGYLILIDFKTMSFPVQDELQTALHDTQRSLRRTKDKLRVKKEETTNQEYMEALLQQSEGAEEKHDEEDEREDHISDDRVGRTISRTPRPKSILIGAKVPPNVGDGLRKQYTERKQERKQPPIRASVQTSDERSPHKKRPQQRHPAIPSKADKQENLKKSTNISSPNAPAMTGRDKPPILKKPKQPQDRPGHKTQRKGLERHQPEVKKERHVTPSTKEELKPSKEHTHSVPHTAPEEVPLHRPRPIENMPATQQRKASKSSLQNKTSHTKQIELHEETSISPVSIQEFAQEPIRYKKSISSTSRHAPYLASQQQTRSSEKTHAPLQNNALESTQRLASKSSHIQPAIHKSTSIIPGTKQEPSATTIHRKSIPSNTGQTPEIASLQLSHSMGKQPGTPENNALRSPNTPENKASGIHHQLNNGISLSPVVKQKPAETTISKKSITSTRHMAQGKAIVEKPHSQQTDNLQMPRRSGYSVEIGARGSLNLQSAGSIASSENASYQDSITSLHLIDMPLLTPVEQERSFILDQDLRSNHSLQRQLSDQRAPHPIKGQGSVDLLDYNQSDLAKTSVQRATFPYKENPPIDHGEEFIDSAQAEFFIPENIVSATQSENRVSRSLSAGPYLTRPTVSNGKEPSEAYLLHEHLSSGKVESSDSLHSDVVQRTSLADSFFAGSTVIQGQEYTEAPSPQESLADRKARSSYSSSADVFAKRTPSTQSLLSTPAIATGEKLRKAPSLHEHLSDEMVESSLSSHSEILAQRTPSVGPFLFRPSITHGEELSKAVSQQYEHKTDGLEGSSHSYHSKPFAQMTPSREPSITRPAIPHGEELGQVPSQHHGYTTDERGESSHSFNSKNISQMTTSRGPSITRPAISYGEELSKASSQLHGYTADGREKSSHSFHLENISQRTPSRGTSITRPAMSHGEVLSKVPSQPHEYTANERGESSRSLHSKHIPQMTPSRGPSITRPVISHGEELSKASPQQHGYTADGREESSYSFNSENGAQRTPSREPSINHGKELGKMSSQQHGYTADGREESSYSFNSENGAQRTPSREPSINHGKELGMMSPQQHAYTAGGREESSQSLHLENIAQRTPSREPSITRPAIPHDEELSKAPSQQYGYTADEREESSHSFNSENFAHRTPLRESSITRPAIPHGEELSKAPSQQHGYTAAGRMKSSHSFNSENVAQRTPSREPFITRPAIPHGEELSKVPSQQHGYTADERERSSHYFNSELVAERTPSRDPSVIRPAMSLGEELRGTLLLDHQPDAKLESSLSPHSENVAQGTPSMDPFATRSAIIPGENNLEASRTVPSRSQQEVLLDRNRQSLYTMTSEWSVVSGEGDNEEAPPVAPRPIATLPSHLQSISQMYDFSTNFPPPSPHGEIEEL